MPRIVISYRRLDMPGIAGWIAERLRARYGADAVFMDVLNLKTGSDYRKQIRKALNQCDALIAIVGPNWFGGSKRGHTKITDANDPIRTELEIALELEINIVPVLVQGAHMPTTEDLPASLKDFSFRQAHRVDAERDFYRDVDELIKAIDDLDPPTNSSSISEPAKMIGAVPVSGYKLRDNLLRQLSPWAVSAAAVAGLLGAFFLYPFGSHFSTTVLSPPVPPAWKASTGSLLETAATVRESPAADASAQTNAPFTLKPIMAKTQPLRTIAFAPNKSTFAFAGDDGIVRLWNSSTFEPVRSFGAYNSARVRAIAFSGDGKYLFSTGSDHSVHMWDVATGMEARSLADWPGLSATEFYSLAVTSDDSSSTSPVRWVKAGGADGAIRTWDLAQKDGAQPIMSPPIQYAGKVHSLSFTPYDTGINDKWASAGDGGDIVVHSFRDNNDTKLKADGRAIYQIKFSKTGDTLASAGWDGVKLWNVRDGAISHAPLRVFEPVHKGYVLKVDWSENQKLLASGGQDGNIVLWDALEGTPINIFGGQDRHSGDVEAVAFHPNKKWLLSLSEDKTLKAWDIETRKLLFTLVSYSDGPYVAYTPSGRYTNLGDLHEHLEKEMGGIALNINAADQKTLYVPPEKFAQYIGTN